MRQVSWGLRFTKLFLNFPQIDYHDHIRQGSLRMKDAIGVNVCWRRLFTTVVSMILVDTYFAYLLDWAMHYHRSFEGAMDPIRAIDKLTYQLIHNPLRTVPYAMHHHAASPIPAAMPFHRTATPSFKLYLGWTSADAAWYHSKTQKEISNCSAVPRRRTTARSAVM